MYLSKPLFLVTFLTTIAVAPVRASDSSLSFAELGGMPTLETPECNQLFFNALRDSRSSQRYSLLKTLIDDGILSDPSVLQQAVIISVEHCIPALTFRLLNLVDPVKGIKDESGVGLLDSAIRGGNENVIYYLLEDAKLPCRSEIARSTFLDYVRKNNQSMVAPFLTAGILNADHSLTSKAVEGAIEHDCSDILDLLHESGVDLRARIFGGSRLPYLYALDLQAEGKNVSGVLQLFRDNKLDQLVDYSLTK